MRKYKAKNFDFEQIFIAFPDVITQDEFNQIEQHYIDEYDSMNPEKGYNKKQAGAAGKLSEEIKKKISDAGKGRKVSKETREKIRKANTGYKHSEESKRKIGEANKKRFSDPEERRKLSEAHKGQPAWNKGKSWSKEVKQKMSAAKKGKKQPKELVEKRAKALRGKGKKIICTTTGEIFPSLKAAEEKYGCTVHSQLHRGHKTSRKNVYFEYIG